jgi:hypothetical protein
MRKFTTNETSGAIDANHRGSRTAQGWRYVQSLAAIGKDVPTFWWKACHNILMEVKDGNPPEESG